MDVNCVCMNDRIVVKFECGKSFLNREILERLISDFNIEFSKTVNEYIDHSDENVMLSDFTAISLSDSDLDGLFE